MTSASTATGLKGSSARTAALAINGGPKVRTKPLPARALFGPEEKAAVDALFDEAIRTGSVFGYEGAQEQAYCREFAASLGGGYADAVNSGSSAVYVALRALEIEPFTEVIVPPITDPGGIMPVALAGCIPVVADAHPGSYNVGPDEIAARLTAHTSAIIVAHIAGEPCDMAPIVALARRHGLALIEDCAQAHGARYRGRRVGTFGDVGAFSTMSGKHHATGAQGGVVFTRDESRYWAARRYADRGKPFGIQGATSNVVASLNLNSSDLAAAIGRVQLAKLDSIVARRREVVQAIASGLRRSRAVSLGWVPEGAEPSYWFLRLHVDTSVLQVDGNTFATALAAEGFPISASYRAAFQARAAWLIERRVFGTSGYPWAAPEYHGPYKEVRDLACPNAEAVLESDFNLHLHERWGEEEVADFLAAVEKVEAAFAKD